MNCENVRQILNDYIDGELNDLESRRVEQHVTGCESCAREERQLRMVCRLVGSCGAQKAPEGLLTGIHLALEKERLVPIRKKRSYAGVMALAASFMLALAGGYYFNIFNIDYSPKTANMVAESNNSAVLEPIAIEMAKSPTKAEERVETASIEAPAPQPMAVHEETEPTRAEAPREMMAAAPARAVRLERAPVAEVEEADETPAAEVTGSTFLSAAPMDTAREEEPMEVAAIVPAAAPSRSGMAAYESMFDGNDADSTGDEYGISSYSNLNEGERARAAVASAIDAMESGDIVMGADRRDMIGGSAGRYSSTGRALSTVSYGRTPGFEYYDPSSEPGVMNYVISANIDALRRTRGQNLFARARDSFATANPSASADACERIVNDSIIAGSSVSYQRTDNAIVVSGPFSELVKIRIDILDKCSETRSAAMTQQEKDQLIRAATSTYQFSDNQASILEVLFEQK